MEKHHVLLVVFGLILMPLAMVPVSASGGAGASLPVSTTISQGATIFIGEEGLNVTSALNSAAGNGPVFTQPTLTTIGWWPSESMVGITDPADIINLNMRFSSFTVENSDIHGDTGPWYLLGPDGISPANDNAIVFNIADPALDLRVLDLETGTELNTTEVPRGTRLGFRLDTNMVAALDSQYRSPVFNDNSVDGYIDIVIRNESGFMLGSLADSSGVTHPLNQQNVSTQPYIWGSPGNPVAPSPWDTGVLDSSGQPLYPAGTYTISAVSRLNNMRSNYRNAGGDYTGKTVSQLRGITLVPA